MTLKPIYTKELDPFPLKRLRRKLFCLATELSEYSVNTLVAFFVFGFAEG